MLGQAASSQTVWSPWSRIMPFSSRKFGPVRSFVLSQSGRRPAGGTQRETGDEPKGLRRVAAAVARLVHVVADRAVLPRGPHDVRQRDAAAQRPGVRLEDPERVREPGLPLPKRPLQVGALAR